MTGQDNRVYASNGTLSRRAVIGAGLGAAGVAALAALSGSRSLTRSTSAYSTALRAPLTGGESAARTWHLAAADELRPAAPGAPSDAEIAELLDLQSRRSDATVGATLRWVSAPAIRPWTDLTLDAITTANINPPRAARLLALVQTAMSDAVVAAADARTVWDRPGPASVVPGLTPIGDARTTGASSLPSTIAAVAGAASLVLDALVPTESRPDVATLAEEATMAPLWLGAAYRGDVEMGFAIGRAIGERALARAAADGADAVWDGTRPTGEGVWQPTPPAFADPPLEPLAGTWRPWAIEGVVAARPAGPPAHGSAAWRAELAAVQDAVTRRTPEQEAAAHFWAGGPGTVTPGGLWIEIARDLIARDGLDDLAAARVLAYLSAALADAFICCWDAKFAYWMARPITADPSLAVLFPTPPFPSFTSGHSTISAAAATTLGYFFPDDATTLAARAEEAKNSRLWAGIHFPIDNEVGAAMGNMVGRVVAELARGDADH